MMSDSEQRPRIRVDATTWRRLNALKQPGDDFDDVVSELLDDTEHDIEIRE